MPSPLVRVKDTKTGHEFSWPEHLIKGVKGIERIDKPAVDASGDTTPPKHKTTVSKAAAKKNSAPKTAQPEPGQQADTKKEND